MSLITANQFPSNQYRVDILLFTARWQQVRSILTVALGLLFQEGELLLEAGEVLALTGWHIL